MKINLNNPALDSFYCPIKKQMGKSLLNCPKCKHFPCTALRVQDMTYLEDNFKHDKTRLERMKGVKMVIVEKTEGVCKLEKRDKFDIDNPTEEDLKGVSKVYVASKCYEKKIKLVPIRQKVVKKK